MNFNYKKIFSSNLRRLRKKKGFYKRQLSKHAGLSGDFVREIEACRCSVTLKTIFALAKPLDCDPRNLISVLGTEFRRTGIEIDHRKIFSSNLKYFRKSLNLSQNDLAQKAGLGRATLSELECNKRDVMIRTIFILASALDRDPSEFLNPNIMKEKNNKN